MVSISRSNQEALKKLSETNCRSMENIFLSEITNGSIEIKYDCNLLIVLFSFQNQNENGRVHWQGDWVQSQWMDKIRSCLWFIIPQSLRTYVSCTRLNISLTFRWYEIQIFSLAGKRWTWKWAKKCTFSEVQWRQWCTMASNKHWLKPNWAMSSTLLD